MKEHIEIMKKSSNLGLKPTPADIDNGKIICIVIVQLCSADAKSDVNSF
jgi:hypothetical protein